MRVETFVLAGSIGQALHHFNDKINSTEYQYLSHPNQLRGLGSNTKIKIIKVGTWYERKPEELKEIHHFLLLYEGHEGILMPKSWIPNSDILNKLDKLIHKAAMCRDLSRFGDYNFQACQILDIYTKYGYIEKRRANELYNKLKEYEIRN